MTLKLRHTRFHVKKHHRNQGTAIAKGEHKAEAEKFIEIPVRVYDVSVA